jgi:general L-amino acid transport system permease protein
MSGATAEPPFAASDAPPQHRMRLSWSDPRFRNIVWQIVALGAVVLVLWYLVDNTSQNLEKRHIATGFGVLWQTSSIPLGDSPISYTPGQSTYLRALEVGVLNTLKVAIVGVILATILGTIVGIGRLSPNWLLAHLTAIYVEVLRDIPVLLQLLFWYVLLQGLPPPKQSLRIADAVFFSNRGIKIPLLVWEPAHTWAFVALFVGIALSVLWRGHAKRRQDATGQKPPVMPVVLGLVIGLPLVVWAAFGAPFTLDMPLLKGFNFQGGATVPPEYTALLVGLVIYTSSYIAEIVRSGIQAVPAGQWEAAQALGLHRGQILRMIVLPQALRVIIPPMTSQYLNLTKNSSLAVAIGYQDIVSVASTFLNQTGQAIEGIAVIMAVYLTISLSISLFMNWYNAHIALVGR